jgi:hypothetical protein
MTLCGCIGLLLLVGSGIWMLIEQFKTSPRWGVVCVVFPVAHLLWMYRYSDRAKHPLLLFIAGCFFFLISCLQA